MTYMSPWTRRQLFERNVQMIQDHLLWVLMNASLSEALADRRLLLIQCQWVSVNFHGRMLEPVVVDFWLRHRLPH